jgi:hypothetical protein
MHAERSVGSVSSVGSKGEREGDGAEADAKGLPRRWRLDYKSSWSA